MIHQQDMRRSLGIQCFRIIRTAALSIQRSASIARARPGSTVLKVQGNRAVATYSFPPTGSGFWLTYFSFGADGAVYADEIPGGSAFERYQQLRVVRDDRSSVLWQQTSADVAPVAS
jgi:hypothetical protein